MFWLIIILVFLNTCVLATEHYRQPAWLDDFQEITNLFFVVLFTFEMFLKMYSLGFQVRMLTAKQNTEKFARLVVDKRSFAFFILASNYM